MKGFGEFLNSMLPSVIKSSKIRFAAGEVTAAIKEPVSGNLIVRSALKNDCRLKDEIAVPDMTTLQKAYKALNNPKVEIQHERDIAYRLNMVGDNTKMSMFLMDVDLLKWTNLDREPDYSLIVDLPLSSIESLRTNYGLVDGTSTRISAKNRKLIFAIGDEALENSASTTIRSDSDVEFSFSVSSEHLSAILAAIPNDASVTMYAFSKMAKIVVNSSTDDYELTSTYFVVAKDE